MDNGDRAEAPRKLSPYFHRWNFADKSAILAAALIAVPAFAAPAPERDDASYVTSGEFLTRPFDAPRFVSALSFEDARRSLEVRLPEEAALLLPYLDGRAARPCRRRHVAMNLDRTDFADFFKRTVLAQEKLTAACGLLENDGARDSLKTLDEALALDPRFLDAFLHRAVASARLGDAEGAGRDFLRSRNAPGGAPEVEGYCACSPALAVEAALIAGAVERGREAHERGLALFRAGRSTAAAAAFTEAIELSPAGADAYLGRAAVRRAAGDLSGARRDGESAARLSRGPRKAHRAPPSRAAVEFPAAGGPPKKGAVRVRASSAPPMRGIDDTEYDENLKRFVRASSLLRRGRSREGIANLKALSDSLSANADYAFLYFEALSELAGAYLRTAGEPACRAPGASERCLFPGGVQDLRADPKDAEEAVLVLETLLELRPADLQARWLLNLAYMAAGRYPGGVPERWLLPRESFGTEGAPRFVDAAPALGLDVLSHAGGSIMEDFDGDGFLDLMASSLRGDEQLRFFRNKGDGSFEDRTEQAGLKGVGGGLHIVQADFNNDGRPDVFIPRQLDPESGSDGRCTLLENMGGGVFEDATLRAGLGGRRPSQVGVWADYDNDGHLDLFLGNDDQKTGQARLLRNKGDGTFIDVTKESGLLREGFAVGAAWGDFDNDGRADLYVSFQGEDNALYRNLGPGKGFQDVTAKSGTAGPTVSFSAWFWDFDNDGWEDLFVFDFPMTPSAEAAAADALGLKYLGNHPRLYVNRRDGTFEDVSAERGLGRSVMAMGANFGDLDNDGWLDLYGGTGSPDLRATVPNLAFRNEEGKSFREVTAATGMGLLEKGHGIAFGDIDNDGDEDLYVEMGGVYDADSARNSLFVNPGSGNRWITLLLEGTRSNRFAVGARIRVDVLAPEGRRSIRRTVGTGGSFGANSLQAEIGLGQASAIESIEILWPATGKRQVLKDPPLDRFLKVVEGTPGFKLLERPKVSLRITR